MQKPIYSADDLPKFYEAFAKMKIGEISSNQVQLFLNCFHSVLSHKDDGAGKSIKAWVILMANIADLFISAENLTMLDGDEAMKQARKSARRKRSQVNTLIMVLLYTELWFQSVEYCDEDSIKRLLDVARFNNTWEAYANTYQVIGEAFYEFGNMGKAVEFSRMAYDLFNKSKGGRWHKWMLGYRTLLILTEANKALGSPNSLIYKAELGPYSERYQDWVAKNED